MCDDIIVVDKDFVPINVGDTVYSTFDGQKMIVFDVKVDNGFPFVYLEYEGMTRITKPRYITHRSDY